MKVLRGEANKFGAFIHRISGGAFMLDQTVVRI